ncbi:hypothetical protein DPM19_04255 [Actinomadura craniellae]|uniref:Ammosamide/lymphostin RiPP family protein n=1 Tax=Actinomadura craniellae TaxID=2231787 RepID=A0A365HAG9_9ACTN|nr:hypothetical protein DPM19_04255 [Actinomadura craniellae]
MADLQSPPETTTPEDPPETTDALADDVEDLDELDDIDFDLEEVENKIAPLALAWAEASR